MCKLQRHDRKSRFAGISWDWDRPVPYKALATSPQLFFRISTPSWTLATFFIKFRILPSLELICCLCAQFLLPICRVQEPRWVRRKFLHHLVVLFPIFVVGTQEQWAPAESVHGTAAPDSWEMAGPPLLLLEWIVTVQIKINDPKKNLPLRCQLF